MIPGYGPSKCREDVVASAASITVKSDLTRITGTTQIDNIFCPVLVGRDSVLIFVYTPDAGVTISAAGNVAVSQALVTNRLYAYMFSFISNKWIPHGVV